jgi:hypothetical protein
LAEAERFAVGADAFAEGACGAGEGLGHRPKLIRPDCLCPESQRPMRLRPATFCRHVGIHPHLRRTVDPRNGTSTSDTLHAKPGIPTLLSALAGTRQARAGVALYALLLNQGTRRRHEARALPLAPKRVLTPADAAVS